MTYTPNEPVKQPQFVSALRDTITTPIVVPAPLAIKVIDHLQRLGCDRLVVELLGCQPLRERHTGLGDK